MKHHLIALSVGVTALVLTASHANSQARNCAPRDTVVERLGEKYGESRQSVGIAANQTIVETYANATTGTWTITVTLPTGATCLVASGRSFEALAAVDPEAMGLKL